MVAFTCLLGRFGVRRRTREGQDWWIAKVVPWVGFGVDTEDSVVRKKDNLSKGMSLRQEFVGLSPDPNMSARGLLASASSLNSIQWIVRGGFCHLR